MATNTQDPSQKSPSTPKPTSKSPAKGRAGAPTDGFVSFWQRAFGAVSPYMTRGLVLLIGVVVLLFVGWGVSNWMEARKEHATELLGRSMRIAEADLLTDKDKDQDLEQNDETPRFKKAEERTAAAVKVIDQLDKDYQSTSAALRAKLVRAGLLYDAGRYPEAETLYKDFINAGPREQALLLLAREGVGLCAEGRGDLAAALAAYQAMAAGGVFRDRARWAEARIYAKQGNMPKAIEVYKELLSKAAPTGAVRDEIQNRLAQLEP